MISEVNRSKEDGIFTDYNPISHFYGGMGLVPQPLPVNSHDDGFVEDSYAMSTNSHRRNSISQRSDSSLTQQLQQNAGASQSRRRTSQVEVSCNTCGKKYKNQICLQKHAWEHHESWHYAKKLMLNKHQSVQIMEAAQALVSLCDVPDNLQDGGFGIHDVGCSTGQNGIVLPSSSFSSNADSFRSGMSLRNLNGNDGDMVDECCEMVMNSPPSESYLYDS